MKRTTSRRSVGTLAEINVTPLLDLAFVLLIIFIITTPLLETTLDVIIPTTATAQDDPDDVDEPLTVAMDRFEQLSIDDEPISQQELLALLRERMLDDRDLAVVLRMHRTLQIQRLVDLMELLKNLGITRVGILTQPEEALD